MSQRLVTDGTYWYRYDKEGNLTEKRLGSQAGTLVGRYTWDYRDRLTKVEVFSEQTGAAVRTVTHAHDMNNRRIRTCRSGHRLTPRRVNTGEGMQEHALQGWLPVGSRPMAEQATYGILRRYWIDTVEKTKDCLRSCHPTANRKPKTYDEYAYH